MRKALLLAGCLGALATVWAATVAAAAQLEIDRIVSRIDGRIITQSDIRQARALKLVDETASDEAARRALENRLLILNELNRAAPLAPLSDDEVRSRRAEWASALGGANADEVLRRSGMSESELHNWMRDDLRIRAYLRRQFGMLSDADRTRAINEWIARLRQRADLPP